MPNEISQLLLHWSDGDATAREKLLPLVYDELRRLARNYLSRERVNHTLQPTALVHEAYLRIVEQNEVSWHSRAQFFGLAATLMRHNLVDHARQHNAEKRGGGALLLSLSAAESFGNTTDVNLLRWMKPCSGWPVVYRNMHTWSNCATSAD